MGPLKVQCLTTCNTVEWDQGVYFDLSGIMWHLFETGGKQRTVAL